MRRRDASPERELLSRSPDLLVEVALDGRILFVSDAVQDVLGRSAKSLIGVSFMELVIPEDHEHVLAIHQKTVETGAEPTLEFRAVGHDGVLMTFEAVVRVFQDERGGQRIIASCRDITQQSAARAAEQQHHTYYRTLVESGSRATAIFSPDGKVLFSNRRFQIIFGRASSGQEFSTYIGPHARNARATPWYCTTPAADSCALEFDYVDDHGQVSWYCANWEDTQAPDGSRLITVVYDDITHRKRIEEALHSIAGRTIGGGPEPTWQMLSTLADALQLERVVFATVDPEHPGVAQVVAAWEDGGVLEIETLTLEGLPDATTAGGEPCIHPAGLGRIMPRVRDQLGRDYQAYAGVPLFQSDGKRLGFVGGYSLKPLSDVELTRSLLSVFGTHVSANYGQHRAAQELLDTQARFDAIAEHTYDMLLEIDEAGKVSYVSNAYLRILGLRADEILGRSPIELVHPDDQAFLDQTREAFLAGRPVQTLVLRTRHADGSWRRIEARTLFFKVAHGAARALILARDFTERFHEELGPDLLNRVVQETADLILVSTPDTVVRFANRAATRVLAPSEESTLEGRTLLEFLAAADSDRLRDEILPNLQLEEPWAGELELRRPEDGQTIATEATIFLFQGGSEGKTRSYLAFTLRDISLRRNAEEALRQSKIRLSQAQKLEAVGRLAGGVAHDFNNLLTAIIGYGDLVLEQLGPKHAVRRDAEEILLAAERAGALTRQLLAFSRSQVLKPEPLNLDIVLANIDRMIRRLIAEDIEVVTFQHGELRSVEADRGQLEQVIVNLVVNARDAMPRGGRLELQTRNVELSRPLEALSGVLEPGEYVVLRVSDTGIGMDEATRERLFEPFFTTKADDQGTGLGLATVYGIVQQSGGQIDVESAPERGTTFSIYLPASNQSAGELALMDVGDAPGGNETILLVEDADPVRRLLERLLRKSGYSVLTAESASAALRQCARYDGPIDLLLTDVVLPKMSGSEVAKRAKELRPKLRVLFMSGFPAETLRQHGLPSATSDLLEKPFSGWVALGTIRRLLDTHPEEPERSMFHVEQI